MATSSTHVISDDYDTMIELASALPYWEAARFIRGETRQSLVDAARIVDNQVILHHPDSMCAKSRRERGL